MGRNRSSKTKGELRTSFMYPTLHQKVVNAVSDELTSTWFHVTDSDNGSNNEYSTHVMGKFRCSNDACSTHVWSSKKIAILIRGYSKNGYNAVVFNQRCRSCNRLGNPSLDEGSYVNRVAYRVKKWAGITMDQPSYNGIRGPPHESRLCEGCKRGICGGGDNGEFY